MKSLLILKNIEVENANAISGFTYGFPAISNFLGFTHALSRKLRMTHQITLDGCAVICHQSHVQAHRVNSWHDYLFSLTRNPVNKDGDPAGFVEEGKMHLKLSLIMECNFDSADFQEQTYEFQDHIKQLAITQRLAGGVITKIQQVEFVEPPEEHDELKKFTRHRMLKLLPGFVLVERGELLSDHLADLESENKKTDYIDAWLDFSALKYRAVPVLKESESISETTTAEWHYVPKPSGGWLVPIATGYRAISKLYQPGEVSKTRAPHTEFRFVESIYSIGEWLSPHRVRDLTQIFWRYHADSEAGWYLCKNNYVPTEEIY